MTVIGDVMYCSYHYSASSVLLSRARTDGTVHYKYNETVNFCGFKCATTLPITVFYKLYFFTFIFAVFITTTTCLQRPVLGQRGFLAPHKRHH